MGSLLPEPMSAIKLFWFGSLILVGALPLRADAAGTLTVHCAGQGGAVYLIGGGPAFTTRHLTSVQDALRDRYRVCRWDMRGVGDNAGLEVDAERSALDQWLADMRRVLPEQPVVLWGHSWGALQALLFARRHPARVKALVLSNPVDPALRSLENIEQKRIHHPHPHGSLALEDLGAPAEDLRNLRSKIASYFVDSRKGWDFARRFTGADSDGALNVRVWEEYTDAPLDETDLEALADKVVGVIYCREDVLQPEAQDQYERLLPNTRHRVLEGCAHFPWEERREAYFKVLRVLLARAVGD